MPDPLAPRPLIVVTVAVLGDGPERDLRQRRNELYAEGVRRAGGEPRSSMPATDEPTRSDAFAAMDGLLLSGGADIDPARYGQGVEGSTGIERPRDRLEAAALDAADARRVPVLGICRGFQAINVFRGGTLLQDVAGHAGPGYGSGTARTHELRVDPASRLGSLLGQASATEVNTYHHQGVQPADLAPGLVATAWADSPPASSSRASRIRATGSSSASSAIPSARSRRHRPSRRSGEPSSTPRGPAATA